MPRQANPVQVTVSWVIAILSGGYMLPWAIAATRARSNTTSIALINVFLGWTLVGWIVALVMALQKEEPQVVVVPRGQQAPPWQQH
jgi:hypothetical protein